MYVRLRYSAVHAWRSAATSVGHTVRAAREWKQYQEGLEAVRDLHQAVVVVVCVREIHRLLLLPDLPGALKI